MPSHAADILEGLTESLEEWPLKLEDDAEPELDLPPLPPPPEAA